MNSYADIIAAIATPPGKGGVAIIRICGEGALAAAEKFFSPASKKRLGDYPARTQVYGYVISENGLKIDDGLACYFKAGASYTGEETVEITSHGGTLVSSMVLERALGSGVRLAEAGEFTRRAFINGRLTLSDAEAIGGLLEAQSREQVVLCAEGSREKLRERFEKMTAALMDVLSSIYARIDYPDEDLGEFGDEEIKRRLLSVRDDAAELIRTYSTGKAIRDGVKTVICGKPNAGKSSLYNMILGFDAAIVTDIKGTTTDMLTESATLGRVTLRLTDTAGIRDGEDVGVIEKIGIERTKAALKEAELVIAMFDLSEELDEDDEGTLLLLSEACGAKIALLNKSDIESERFDKTRLEGKFDRILSFSTKNGEQDLGRLRDAVGEMFTDESIKCGEHAIISSARQHAILTEAHGILCSAVESIENGLVADMVSSDIERALRVLSEADGREVSEALTNDIFSKFCVGK